MVLDRHGCVQQDILKDNIVFILVGASIDDAISNLVVARLLFLEAENPDRGMLVYINARGRSVTAGLTIYYTTQFI